MGKFSSGLSFETLCKVHGLPIPKPEFPFHPTRKWRFDYLFPDWWVAVEVQGGVWKHGRHSRGVGQVADFAKINAAQCMGYIVLQITHQQIQDGSFAQIIRDALDFRAAENAMWDDEAKVGIPDHVLRRDRDITGAPLPF